VGLKNAVALKKTGRVIEIDILRGFLLLWMTLTHLPTKASMLSNQTFGFVSGAEGFIFLAAFMVGQIQFRAQQKRGEPGALRDIAKRTFRVYAYHCGLLAIAFTLVAAVGIEFHRDALRNLLSFYLQSPKQAVIAALLLQYRPSLLDILPMYVVFMALTPLARKVAQFWSWEPVIYASFVVWAAAQFGIRAWAYRHIDLFGLHVPENSTGSFDLFGWQLLWIVGLALGTMYAESVAVDNAAAGVKIPGWLLQLSFAVALIFLILRYCPTDQWMDPNVYGWLVDKWHLAPVRVINFSALALLLVRFGSSIAAIPVFPPLAQLGRASIEVFSVHVLCCIGADALSHDADPNLPWWQQAIVLVVTISALFATARAHQMWVTRRVAPPPRASHGSMRDIQTHQS
jgi:hypothetical protein